MNMPAWSRCSPFGTRLDENRAARQGHHGIHEDDLAREVLPRQRGDLEAHELPPAQPVGIALGHIEARVLRAHRLQRDQRRLRRDVRPDAHEAPADDAGKRRAHHRAVEPGPQEIVAGVGTMRFGLGLLEVRSRRRVLGDQLLGTLQRLAGELQLRFGLSDLRLQLGVVHLEQGHAGADLLPFPDQDFGDATGHLRSQLDRLDRFDLAGGRDCIDHGVAEGGSDFDGHGKPTTARSATCRGVGLLARGRSREEEQNSKGAVRHH